MGREQLQLHHMCLPGNRKTFFVKSHLRKGKKKKFRLFPGALGLGLLRAAPCCLFVLGTVPGTPQSLEATFCPDLALSVPAPGTHHTRQCPGPRLALSPSCLAPGQGNDCRLTHQQEVGCFDDKRESRGALALRGAQLGAEQGLWGVGTRWWSALGGTRLHLTLMGCPWEVRGWKTQPGCGHHAHPQNWVKVPVTV